MGKTLKKRQTFPQFAYAETMDLIINLVDTVCFYLVLLVDLVLLPEADASSLCCWHMGTVGTGRRMKPILRLLLPIH